MKRIISWVNKASPVITSRAKRGAYPGWKRRAALNRLMELKLIISNSEDRSEVFDSEDQSLVDAESKQDVAQNWHRRKRGDGRNVNNLRCGESQSR